MNIGLKIKELRTKRNISAKKLAEHLGVRRESIYGYENGTTSPPLEKIEKIADFFGEEVSFFVESGGEIKLPKTKKELNFEDFLLRMEFYFLGKFNIKREQWKEAIDDILSAKFRVYPSVQV